MLHGAPAATQQRAMGGCGGALRALRRAAGRAAAASPLAPPWARTLTSSSASRWSGPEGARLGSPMQSHSPHRLTLRCRCPPLCYSSCSRRPRVHLRRLFRRRCACQVGPSCGRRAQQARHRRLAPRCRRHGHAVRDTREVDRRGHGHHLPVRGTPRIRPALGRKRTTNSAAALVVALRSLLSR